MAEKELPPDPYDKAIARARAEGRVEGLNQAVKEYRKSKSPFDLYQRLSALIAAAERELPEEEDDDG